jgi:hypothetical protein
MQDLGLLLIRVWNFLIKTEGHVQCIVQHVCRVLCLQQKNNIGGVCNLQAGCSESIRISRYANGSRCSSVSIVSGYGLDGWTRFDPRQRQEHFSSNLCVQTSSGAHPASCTMDNGGPFSGGKERPGRDADHSPHLLPNRWMSRSYTSSPPCASIGVLWDCFASVMPITTSTLLCRLAEPAVLPNMKVT